VRLSKAEALAIMGRLGMEVVLSARHARAFLVVDGRRLLAVHCPLGVGDLPGTLARRFRLALRLTEEEFESVRAGTLSRDDYVRLASARVVTT
jgi:hypothetical protein